MISEALRKSYYAGILIPFWLAIGVFVAGLFYPGYDHINQAMSELGAVGSPTKVLSPFINNYPLGLLFIAFGWSVVKTFRSALLPKLTGMLIIAHGVSSFFAGYYACDVGCNPESELPSQLIHGAAGFVMFITLSVASSIWVYIGARQLKSKRLSVFSAICTVVALAVLPAMAASVESGYGFGLYQRINYGVSVVWVSGLAVFLLHRSTIESLKAND